MKAVVIDEYGGNDRLRVAELAKPTPGRGKVLVRIEAASVNPIDWKVARGFFTLIPGQSFPLVLGSDFSGVVESVGAGVSGFAPGDEVFGMGSSGAAHTYAEFAAISAKTMTRKPQAVAFDQAAAATLVGVTTLAALKGAAAPAPGKRVFVNGGAGGVGSFAVQYAKSQGAEVIASCGQTNLQFVTELGADRVIDYRQHDPVTQLEQVDVIFDTVGTLDPRQYWPVMRRGGRIVSTGNGPRGMEELAAKYGRRWWLLMGALDGMKYNLRGRRAHGVGYGMALAMPTADRLRRVGELLHSGAVTMTIQQHYPMSEVAAAFAASEGGHVRGKLVLLNRWDDSAPQAS